MNYEAIQGSIVPRRPVKRTMMIVFVGLYQMVLQALLPILLM